MSGSTVSQRPEARESAAPGPNPALGALDFLAGSWSVEGRESGPLGEIRGRVEFEWMKGGFFLVQHVELDYIGRQVSGTEYVGYDAESEQLRSYFFSNEGPGPFGGVALEYVWELAPDALTIWGGFVGSPAAFKARLSEDRNTIAGRWQWPGGGYEATMTRIG